MSTNYEPMDVYSSRMDIPFDVAAYCRGHKFNPVAVDLARAIRDEESARLALKFAEKRLEETSKRTKEQVDRARNAMNTSKTV